MVQAVSDGFLSQRSPVRSLQMPAVSFLANFFSLKIEDKGKSRTSRSRDMVFEAVINIYNIYIYLSGHCYYYIVREVLSVKERDTDRERERDRERRK